MPGPPASREAATLPPVRHAILVAAFMAAVTCAALWPQVRSLDALPKHNDPLFSTWRLAWIAHQLPRDPVHLYDANIFWPERDTLAQSDGMPFVGAAAAPLVWFGVPLVLVYNLCVLASFVLCGTAMYFWVRSLTGRLLPSLVAGVAFAFYPFRLEHYPHLELLWTFWMPAGLWALERTLAAPHRWRRGVVLGVIAGGQYLTCIYFGILFAFYLAVVGLVLTIGSGRLKGAIPSWTIACLVGAALVAPIIPPYVHVIHSTGERRLEEVTPFSATPGDYLAVVQPNRHAIYDVDERQTYPGLFVVLLALAAFWPPVDRMRWALTAGLLVMFEFSLGTHGWLQPLLYRYVLPFRAMRAPARASMLVGLSLTTLAGLGAARLLNILPRRPVNIAVAGIMCFLLIAETRPLPRLVTAPTTPSIYRWFETHPRAVIVEVPDDYLTANIRYMLNSMAHWERMVNGFSGSVPQTYRTMHAALRSFPSDATIALLRANAVQYAVVHEEMLGRERYAAMLRAIAGQPALTLVSSAKDGNVEDRIYAIHPSRIDGWSAGAQDRRIATVAPR